MMTCQCQDAEMKLIEILSAACLLTAFHSSGKEIML